MRVLLTVALIVVFLEAVVAFACFAGWYWLGGGLWGTVLVAAVIVLIIAPWIGEMRVEMDSQEGWLAVSMGWWFALRATQDPREMRMRIVILPLRFRPKSDAEKPPRSPKTAATKRRARPSAASIVRMVPAALQALVDLLWEARELSLRVQAPVQNPYADAGIAALVGKKHWGPMHLSTVGTGDRAVWLRYRAGLLRATLTLLYCALQGRPWRLRPRRRK